MLALCKCLFIIIATCVRSMYILKNVQRKEEFAILLRQL